jgi:hypothetical protein
MTDETKFTPTPWVTDGGLYAQAIYKPTDGGRPFYRTVCNVSGFLIPPEEASANAHLISAAPDLYEALRNLWQVCQKNNYEIPKEYDQQITQAFAKADGKIKPTFNT